MEMLRAWGLKVAEYTRHLDWLSIVENKEARALGMLVLVLGIVCLIGLLYGNNNQKIGKVHFAFRPHQASRAKFDGIIAQKDDDYLPVQSDGMSATVNFYYGWYDSRGRFRRERLAQRQLRLSIQASAVPMVAGRIHGCEAVEDVQTEDVFIPALDERDTDDQTIRATPNLLTEYYEINRVLDRWTADNAARLVSIPASLVEELRDERASLIQEESGRLRKARAGPWWRRLHIKSLAEHRISTLGGYYIDMRFHWDPYFVLFRHPDRDLKMTAWLTVLTSAFSLVMDLWPIREPPSPAATSSESSEHSRIPVRTAPLPHRTE